MPPTIPLELLNEILSYLRGDSTTLKAVRQSSIGLALLSGPHAFSNPVFRDLNHIFEYFDLASALCSTIPKTLRCDSICFKNTNIDDTNLPIVYAKMAGIRLNGSLAFHVDTGNISPAALHLASAWGSSVRRLSIYGGTHSPSAFFECLMSFPSLRSLALKKFRVKQEAGAPGHHYKLPIAVTELSLSHCATLWAFLGVQVQPGGGLDGVRDLYIQELFFNGKDGIPEMRLCLRELHRVRNLTLDPVYHYRFPNFNCTPYEIYRRSWEATLLQMRGLRLLRVNCANLPQKAATESVCMYALQFADSAKADTITVEIYAPHSLDLSHPGACEDLLDATNQPKPTTTEYGQANLVIRGLLGRLPKPMDGSQQVMVQGYPVTFRETDWDEAIGSRLDGVGHHSPTDSTLSEDLTSH